MPIDHLSISPIRAHWSTYRNYIWCIQNEQKECILVDPGESEPVLAMMNQADLTLKGIIITHHHIDHITGVDALLQTLGEVPVYGPGNSPFNRITHPLSEGDTLSFPTFDLALTVMETPGHTFSHISLYSDELLFSGDALFSAGCGIVIDGGDLSDLYHSAQRLAALPENTLMYCPHEYTTDNLRFAVRLEPNNAAIQARMVQAVDNDNNNIPNTPSTIAVEKQTNPFLRADLPEVKARCEAHCGHELSTPLAVFEVIRAWR